MTEGLVRVLINGEPAYVPRGTLAADAAHVKKPCGGHGKCGKCRVTVRGGVSPVTSTERALLTDEEIAAGARLACLTRVTGECEILSSSTDGDSVIVTASGAAVREFHPVFSVLGLAVDIGTTTVAARLYDAKGNILSEATALNPQSEFGTDVISRIEAALGGKDGELASSVRKTLDGMIVELCLKAGESPGHVDGAVITGNTVMLYLLTGQSVEPFSHAPFRAPVLFGETVFASSLSLTTLRPETRIYLPSCISAFVGADITCSVLSSGICDGGAAMLADIGTNGELALYGKGKLTVCSTAAGPAFEGVGISMGMQGSDGAIDRVTEVNGKLSAHVIGDTDPVGICGSGLIDAASCLLRTGVLDESGYLDAEKVTVSGRVSVTRRDIRMLQMAKSAIYGGIMTLLDAGGLDPSDVGSFCIAGGFGYYLNVDNAADIGLIPRAVAGCSYAAGNAALGGASMILLDSRNIEKSCRIAESAGVCELSANPVFERYYTSGMMFGGCDGCISDHTC